MKCLLSVTLFAILAGTAFSAVHYVPDHFPTIQAAVDGAANGDTVIVRPGTYRECVIVSVKSVSLVSEMGPKATVIDGMRKGTTMLVFSAGLPEMVLDGFTLRNGHAMNGGGLVVNGTTMTVRNNVICRNSAGHGGGCYFYNFYGTFADNRVGANSSTYHGGGIKLYESNAAPDPLTIERNRITFNISGQGAGLSLGGAGNVLITENAICDNRAAFFGGGIYHHGVWKGMVIKGNRIRRNSADQFNGGGLHCNNSWAEISFNDIRDNSCRTIGGGIWGYGEGLRIVNNTIAENASQGWGGGAEIHRAELVAGNLFAGNTSSIGGGLSCPQLDAVVNCTFVSNVATTKGGAIFTETNLDLTGSILWGNDAPEGKEIVLYNHHQYDPILTVSHCDVAGGQGAIHLDPGSTLNWSAGNIDVDPAFADPAGGDYHLTWLSPCRDAGLGNPALPAEDIDGNPRVAQGGVDMGADEVYPFLYSSGTATPGGQILFKAIGVPGASVTLCHSLALRAAPLPTPYGPLYLERPIGFHRNGVFPPSGYSEKAHTLSPVIPRGKELHYQMFTAGRLWNVMTLVVR